MQKFGESYGFWLKPEEDTSDEEYSEIMRGISHVCEETQKKARQHGFMYEVYGYPIQIDSQERLYMSVCLYQGVALFGVFDENAQQIQNIASASLFQSFTLGQFDNFAYRNIGAITMKSNGKKLKHSQQMLSAWCRYIYENQEIVTKALKADKDKTILLEMPTPQKMTL